MIHLPDPGPYDPRLEEFKLRIALLALAVVVATALILVVAG